MLNRMGDIWFNQHNLQSSQPSPKASINPRLAMKAIPMMYTKNFSFLFSGAENSSTMTSEHAMYMKVPAAKQLKMTSSSGELVETAQPTSTPIGVKMEKRNRSKRTWLSLSGKALAMEVPRAIPAAPLCNTMAIVSNKTDSISFLIPRAMPSNSEWTPRPMSRTYGVKVEAHLRQQPGLLRDYCLSSNAFWSTMPSS